MFRVVFLICLLLPLLNPVRGQDSKELVTLDGTWYFAADTFLVPGEYNALIGNEADVPGRWNDYASGAHGPFGFGSYYRQVIIPDIPPPFAMRFPDVLSAHRVYINEDLLYESGRPATRRRDEVFGNYRYIRMLPAGISAGDTVNITVHLSNFHHRNGGIVRSVELGSYQEMTREKEQNLFLEAMQLGGVAVMGIFFLIYFLFRKQDKYIVTFSLLCLGIFLYVFFNGEYVLYSLFPGLGGAIILDIIYVTFYFTFTVNLILISELFPNEIPYWLIQIAKIVGIVCILAVILLPMHIYSYTMPVFRVYAIIAGFYLIYQILMASLHHRPGAKIIWVAVTVIFLFMINDLLYNAHIIETGELIGWGVLFYLMILMIVSSRRFSRAINNEEKLLKDLRKLNDNLTFKVRERTLDLEEKSRIIERQQAQILKKNEELIKSREEEKSIIKNIVHDLKAPFNKISGLISVFEMEADKENVNREEMDQILKMIRQVAEEGGSMVEDLNVVTFFEDTLAGHGEIEEVDLMQLLNDLVQGYRGYATKKDIELEFISPVRKYMISTHPKSLTRIVDNLLSNAIKFSPQQTRVWLSLKPRHDDFEIAVKDEGPGFTEEDKKNIFEKFQKLSARPTSGESSTGLGLNIVKTLTEGLGGTVILLDESYGAHFILTFPRKTPHAEDQATG